MSDRQSENLVVVKLVETVVTTYTVCGHVDSEAALNLTRLTHENKSPASDCEVVRQAVDKQTTAKVEYQKNNDRPKPKLCGKCTPTWKCPEHYRA